LERAPDGPLHPNPHFDNVTHWGRVSGLDNSSYYLTCHTTFKEANAVFFAHAPADIARLLSALVAERAECKRLKARDTFLDRAQEAPFIKERNDARRWAAAWREAARLYRKERDELQAEAERLRREVDKWRHSYNVEVEATRRIREEAAK